MQTTFTGAIKDSVENVVKAKKIVFKLAAASTQQGCGFADFEYDCHHDWELKQLISKKFINILVQEYAALLD